MGELLRLDGLASSDLEAWRALAARAAEPNPFFEPEYALPLARHLGGDPRLLVVRDGADWVACLPVRRGARWHRAPLPHVATWRAHVLYALLGTPLVDAQRLDDGAAGLVDALRAAPLFAALEWLHEDGPVHAALQRALRARGAPAIRFERFERAALARRPDGAYLEQTVSPKHRREWRRQRRRLGEEIGEVAVRDRAGEAEAVEAMMRMEAASGVATPLLADPRHAAFFREMCAGFAAAGRLQMLELRAGGRALAYKCNLEAGDGWFMFKIAFEPGAARFSPGMQLELETLNSFHGAPKISWMDSCADANNAMINRLWPDRRKLATLVLPAPGVRGIVARPAVGALRRVRDRINQQEARTP